MSEQQQNLFDDPTVSAEEREVFGDRIRPVRPELDVEGDFVVGFFVDIERDVDLKTGFGSVDIVTFEAISGALAGRTKRPFKGQQYAFALLHATAKNQYIALQPQPVAGERIAFRRGRNFTSTQGESMGKELASWDIVLPDREPVPGTSNDSTSKSTSKSRSRKVENVPAPDEEPF